MIEIVYESNTGNTKALAEKIKVVFESAKLESVFDNPTIDSEIYFVGSWCDKGSMSDKMKAFVSTLHGKSVFVFGTCGFGADEAYLEKIGKNMLSCVPEDNEILGTFICPGKIDDAYREKYEAMKNEEETRVEGEKMLQNFEDVKTHPSEEDFMNLEMKLCTLDITLNDAK